MKALISAHTEPDMLFRCFELISKHVRHENYCLLSIDIEKIVHVQVNY